MDPEPRLFISVIAGLMVGATLMACKQMWHETMDPHPCVCRHDRRLHDMTFTNYTTQPTQGPCGACSCKAFIPAA